MAAPELSIVMPVYNEGDSIERVLRALEQAVTTPHEVLVVYDFDEDTTVGPVQALSRELPSVRLHRNDRGRGVLNAMRAGIDAATGTYVLVTMADGSDEHHIVDDMVAMAQAGAAVVVASRYMPGGRQVGGPPLKSAMSRFAGLSLHWVGRLPVRDPTNSFKLYRRDFLDTVAIESTGGFELGLELTVKAYAAGLSIVELPTTWHDRDAGESRFDMRSWLPLYLKWYLRGLSVGAGRVTGSAVRSGLRRTGHASKMWSRTAKGGLSHKQ